MMLVIIFIISTLFDILWTLCIKAIRDKQAVAAATLSAILEVIGIFVIVVSVKNPLAIAAAALGAYCGTYITVKYVA